MEFVSPSPSFGQNLSPEQHGPMFTPHAPHCSWPCTNTPGATLPHQGHRPAPGGADAAPAVRESDGDGIGGHLQNGANAAKAG
jgi:hypothetical protein